MQEYARSRGMSEKPRQLLVGGMKAEHILLSSPLLKWYLTHGMKVRKIDDMVEFQRQRCFQCRCVR